MPKPETTDTKAGPANDAASSSASNSATAAVTAPPQIKSALKGSATATKSKPARSVRFDKNTKCPTTSGEEKKDILLDFLLANPAASLQLIKIPSISRQLNAKQFPSTATTILNTQIYIPDQEAVNRFLYGLTKTQLIQVEQSHGKQQQPQPGTNDDNNATVTANTSTSSTPKHKI